MSKILFSINWLTLWISLAGFTLAYFLFHILKSSPPHLAFSSLKDLQMAKPNRAHWSLLPLYFFTILCFALALIDPHFLVAHDQKKVAPLRTTLPTEGIAIYLILDQSGSMAQKIRAGGQSIRKIDLLKDVTARFIQDQSSNLIGIVAFARIPQVVAPLTLDQKALQDTLDQLDVVKKQEEDGTALGYAIFKTAHLIAATRHFAQQLRGKGEPAYTIKGAAMIVVTDGLQNPSALDQGNRLRTLDLEEAAAYAKSQDIRLYLVNIDPNISSAEFAPHRRQMKRITEMTGGAFYLLQNTEDLPRIYQEIARLEKGEIFPQANQVISQRLNLYPFLIGLGLMGLFSLMFLETTFLRRIP